MSGDPGEAASLTLATASRGTVLRLRCRPGRPRTTATGIHGGALKLDVAAPPEKGRANREVVAWLVRVLAVPAGSLTITAGEGSRDKSVLVSGMEAETVRERLREVLEP